MCLGKCSDHTKAKVFCCDGVQLGFKQAEAPETLLAEQADQELQELVKQLNFAFPLRYRAANDCTAVKSANCTNDRF